MSKEITVTLTADEIKTLMDLAIKAEAEKELCDKLFCAYIQKYKRSEDDL